MKKYDYSKWNNYQIGNVTFINSRIDHPHRKIFVDFAINNNDINSIVEIGPGELIEYNQIHKKKKVSYTIIDVSDVFLNNCRTKYPEVKTYKCAIEDVNCLGFSDNQFDIIYAASLLEHSRDIRLMIKRMLSIARRFHFVLFKWRYVGNQKLKSKYYKKKKYWSTSFNIYKLLDFISSTANIEYVDLIKSNGCRIPHAEYAQGLKDKAAEHRTGDYLIIHGNSNQ